MLTADDFRKKRPALKQETVAVPALGGDLIVSEMSAGDRDAYEREAQKAKDTAAPNTRALFLVRCLRGEDGRLLLRPDEHVVLAGWPASVLDPLIEVAVRLNGIGEKEVTRLAGESEGAPSADSPSASA